MAWQDDQIEMGARKQAWIAARMPAVAGRLPVWALAAVLWMAPGAGNAQAQSDEAPHPGRGIYLDNCSQCHGEEGDGRGHGFQAMYPRPRDLSSGMFKFRTTESGEYPLADNLEQMIADGMPGTTMPPWKHVLSGEEIRQVAGYIQSLYTEEDDDPPAVMKVGVAPPSSPELVARGRELFVKIECTRCHGEAGRGDGNNSMNLKEDWNQEPIFPRNLTAGWLFRGGRRPEDIYRVILSGLNGTPMPSHIDEELLAEEADRWALVHYVRSLGPDTEPTVRSTLIAKWVEGELPLNNTSPLWKESQSYYIPLAGQVILKPRLFQPSVRYLWAQALYNTDEIALRIRWVDPTAKDSEAYLKAKKPSKEEGQEEEEEKGVDEKSHPANGETARPSVPMEGDPEPVDELAIQFPFQYKPGEALPYFLMGNPGKPVALWVFRSDREGMMRAKSSRFGQWKEQSSPDGLQSLVTHHQGQYTLIVKRKRIADTGAGFGADPGQIPISFSVVDGFKGEKGARRAMATWYTLLLERRVETKVFYLPVLAGFLILGLEWRLLTRTRNSPGRKNSQT